MCVRFLFQTEETLFAALELTLYVTHGRLL